MSSRSLSFPGGRRFAFSILDDTDDSTLENVRPVYDRLRDYGFRTTKTVWPLDCPEGSRHYFAADTLQRSDYLSFVRELVRDGFELASHGATMESSTRERTLRSLEFLEREFGRRPRLYANHGENRENLYWGAERFRTPGLNAILKRIQRRHPRGWFLGEVEDSPYFWGDEARSTFQYVRNFTFPELNVLAVNPEMPYRLASTPYVNNWFSTADAHDAQTFRRRVSRDALDRLEEDGGVCILSTHLGKGFTHNGRLERGVDDILRHLAAKPGWFVPVSVILDHLRDYNPQGYIGSLGLLRLELRFLSGWLSDRDLRLSPAPSGSVVG